MRFVHYSLSYQNKELSHEQLKEIALQITQQLGYEENPILIYEHHDTRNNHVHIVSSRVGINGKRIKDNFEGKRANHFLNAILNREPHQEFNQHLNLALAYQFGTHAQFALLMEINGYKAQKTKDQFLFFKHGEKQGYIKLSDLDKRMALTEKSGKNTNQLKAIIYKYRKHYSGKLRSNHDHKFTTEPTKFESDLPILLKQKFGFDFIFFSGKNKEMPYGYVLIDHNRREVYKGSDLLKLDLLIFDAANKEKTAVSKNDSHGYTKTVNENSKEDLQSEIEYKNEMQLGDILGDFLEEIERANYQGNGRQKTGGTESGGGFEIWLLAIFSINVRYYELIELHLFYIMNIMKSRTSLLLPTADKVMKEFGNNLKLARLRRKLSVEQIAERAGISRTTLWLVEKGAPSVAMGTYAQVLFVLGLEKDLLQVASDDLLGRKLQDAQLSIKERSPKRKR
ncbi:MAG TPA: relaxase/mobilization nuclease domain-containing protein [Hanamia sp.]|nr:relaxase/mobilization nuclease domain-containing protein [Hanamia sp.]